MGEFETNHQKDAKSLTTINSAQIFLKQYWGFYMGKGKRADIMNDKIKKHFDKSHNQCFMMYQLALTAREILVKNKINLPFGKGLKPSDEELRSCMPRKPKVISPHTPPKLKDSNQILALFASLQKENNI